MSFIPVVPNPEVLSVQVVKLLVEAVANLPESPAIATSPAPTATSSIFVLPNPDV
jgi:hypothetical protein